LPNTDKDISISDRACCEPEEQPKEHERPVDWPLFDGQDAADEQDNPQSGEKPGDYADTITRDVVESDPHTFTSLFLLTTALNGIPQFG
jgi:hypothetical protein